MSESVRCEKHAVDFQIFNFIGRKENETFKLLLTYLSTWARFCRWRENTSTGSLTVRWKQISYFIWQKKRLMWKQVVTLKLQKLNTFLHIHTCSKSWHIYKCSRQDTMYYGKIVHTQSDEWISAYDSISAHWINQKRFNWCTWLVLVYFKMENGCFSNFSKSVNPITTNNIFADCVHMKRSVCFAHLFKRYFFLYF